jgi:antitoxin YefM
MKTAPLAAVKAHLSSLIDEVVRTHEQVTITRHGEPVVIVLALDDYESLMETLALLDDHAGRERLIEAEAAVGRGDYTTRDEMTRIMEARRERDTSR